MRDRKKIFESALDRTRQVLRKFPGDGPLESVEKQLEYLLGLETGEHNDRSRLRDIILGVQAGKLIEQLDSELADMLVDAAIEARDMDYRRY